jgi:hypothetical protein
MNAELRFQATATDTSNPDFYILDELTFPKWVIAARITQR